MQTRAWKVYGRDGHRQGLSFDESVKWDFSSKSEGTRILELINSDVTGTNDYTILKVTRNTYEECDEEASGQITDGAFENYRVGNIVEIDVSECPPGWNDDYTNTIRGWDFSVMNSEGDILYEDFDFETEEEAENAAMAYIKENNINDYVLDVSQPDW